VTVLFKPSETLEMRQLWSSSEQWRIHGYDVVDFRQERDMSCNIFSVWPLMDGWCDASHTTNPEPLQCRPRQCCRVSAACRNQVPLWL